MGEGRTEWGRIGWRLGESEEGGREGGRDSGREGGKGGSERAIEMECWGAKDTEMHVCGA